MADGPTLRPKSTGQQKLPCPEMKWKWKTLADSLSNCALSDHVCLSLCISVSLNVCLPDSVCVCICVQEFEGKSLLFTWIYGVVIDRLYDVFLGVYIMVWIGGHRFTVSFTVVLDIDNIMSTLNFWLQ